MAFRGLTEGKDVDGIARKLGDRDSMGHIVGFIDEDGNCWETVTERDGAITAGRYQDAMLDSERTGGPEPDLRSIAIETCLDAESIPHAMEEAEQGWAFILRYRPIARQQMVERLVERLLDEPDWFRRDDA